MSINGSTISPIASGSSFSPDGDQDSTTINKSSATIRIRIAHSPMRTRLPQAKASTRLRHGAETLDHPVDQPAIDLAEHLGIVSEAAGSEQDHQTMGFGPEQDA